MSAEEPTIRRGTRNARYTAVPNHVFEDVRLSMEARWLLGYLLSKPDGWTVRLGDIRKKGGCGRDKARSMIGELVDAGYAEREPARKEGKFNGLSVVIYDEPQQPVPVEADGVASLPQTEKPATAKPATVSPGPVNPTLVKTEGLETPESSEERESGRESREDGQSDALEAKDRPGTAEFEKRVQRFCNGTGYIAGQWKGWDGASLGWISGMFAALSLDERAEAERWRDAYLLNIGERKPQPVGVFLRDRAWNALHPSLLDRAEKMRQKVGNQAGAAIEAKPFGKLWQAWRLKLLVGGPTGPAPRLTAFEQRQVDSGAWDLPKLMREKLAKVGWPQVNNMHDRAARGGSVTVPAELQPLADLMEQVRVGSDRWIAWQHEHAKRGWPWLPDPELQEWVYFPAGGPEGMAEFEMAVRGGHDGDRQQAAE